MNVSREEAAQALADIGKARERIVQLKGYHHGAPHFIVWGLVWLFANTITQFWPEQQRFAWPLAVAIGVIAGFTIGYLQSRRSRQGTPAAKRERWIGSRLSATAVVMFGFIVCVLAIAQPETSREGNAIVSIFFPFAYMACGLWAGRRLFVIGIVTAVAIMAGYFLIQGYFSLWMGVFGGGSLIAGGIWLRTA
ncbi:MAG: hypothetical protein ABMA14_08790 [Hyphomonadaceae bacterium]